MKTILVALAFFMGSCGQDASKTQPDPTKTIEIRNDTTFYPENRPHVGDSGFYFSTIDISRDSAEYALEGDLWYGVPGYKTYFIEGIFGSARIGMLDSAKRSVGRMLFEVAEYFASSTVLYHGREVDRKIWLSKSDSVKRDTDSLVRADIMNLDDHSELAVSKLDSLMRHYLKKKGKGHKVNPKDSLPELTNFENFSPVNENRPDSTRTKNKNGGSK